MYLWVVVVTSIVTFIMTWGLGANDLANSFGTAYGSKVLTIKQIVLIASFCEFAGAMLMGSSVAKTVAGTLTSPGTFAGEPYILMHGMLSAQLATGVWLFAATKLRVSVSTTHSIIGAVVGFAMMFAGPGGVRWSATSDRFPFVQGVVPVFISWVTSPLLSVGASMLIFGLLRRFVLRHPVDGSGIRTTVSFVVITFVTVWLNLFFIFSRGMRERIGWGDDKSAWVTTVIATGVSLLVGIASPKLTLLAKAAAERHFQEEAEKEFQARKQHEEEMELRQRAFVEEQERSFQRSTSMRRHSGRIVEQSTQTAGGAKAAPGANGAGDAAAAAGGTVKTSAAAAGAAAPAGAGPSEAASDGQFGAFAQSEQGSDGAGRTPPIAPACEGGPSSEPLQIELPAAVPITTVHSTQASPAVRYRANAGNASFRSQVGDTEPFTPGGTFTDNASVPFTPGGTRRRRTKAMRQLLPTEPTAFSNNVMTVFNESFGSMADVYPNGATTEQFHPQTEWIFKILQIFSAMVISFAHGANTLSNSVGPLAAVYSIHQNGRVVENVSIEIWMLAMGAAGVILGLATMGQRILKVLGEEMVILTPSRGFSAQFAASLVTILASGVGMPISTTHAVTGAVVGIGLIDGASNVRWDTVRRLLAGWVITIVVTCIVSALFFGQAVYAPETKRIFS